jgi:hypothetical protein
VQKPDREHGAIRGVNTRERQPMIPGDLPRHAGRRAKRHDVRGYVSGVARTMTKAVMPVNDA